MSNFCVQFNTSNSELIKKVQDFIVIWNSDQDFIETNTSGSTGSPKIIRLLKKNMEASAEISGNYFQFSEGKKIMLSLSIDTIGGKMIVVRAIQRKMTLIVSDLEKNPIKNLVEPIYFISLVPYQLQTILEQTPKKIDLVDNVLLGGAPVSEKLIQKIRFLRPNFYESYGMTETMSHIAIKNLKSSKMCFEALGKTYFSTENDALIITAPDLNIENLVTNDLVELINHKQFIWLGRKDFVINSGGKKFHPELIEKKLEFFIPYRFFIHKETDEKLGEKIILLIENSPSIQLKNAIQEICLVKLEKYEIPKKIYFLEAFVETNSNKINRIETFNKLIK